MAGHYSIPQNLNQGVIEELLDFINDNSIESLKPFAKYRRNNLIFQRLTDRNEEEDTDVVSVYPTTLYDHEGMIADFCIAEIHLNKKIINKIYCVL